MIVKGVCHFRIENERDVLQKFQTRAAVRPLIDEIVKPESPPGIVLRYLQTDLLKASATKPLNRSEIKHVARTVLESLAILHDNDYIHTGKAKVSVIQLQSKSNPSPDIKPSNILCNYKHDFESKEDDTHVRISEALLADFGSCFPSSSSYAKKGELIGAPIFRSPEACLNIPWGTSTDIWSFGAMVGTYILWKCMLTYHVTAYEPFLWRLSYILSHGLGR